MFRSAHRREWILTPREEVISLRKKAVSLLLSEHRAGECEAQCRIVCPMGSLMNRLLIAGEHAEAAELIRSEMNGGELNCITCKAFL